jgi:hypothetical protein
MSETIKGLMALITVASFLGIAGGLTLCLFDQRRTRGKQIAFYGAVLFVFVFSFALFQKPSSSSATVPTTQIVEQKQPTYKEVLSQLRIGSLSWDKNKGFGTIMSATFVVHNDSPIVVKDVVVTCRHSANSGTTIDSNTRTVYDIIRSKSYASVVDMNMGFISSEAIETKCSVVGYSVA